jgi:hypothetical protein
LYLNTFLAYYIRYVASTLHYFTQPIPKAGFMWRDVVETTLNSAGKYLVSDGPMVSRAYNQATDSGVFRNFADTKLTEDGILDFANRHGRLGAVAVPIPAGEGDRPGSRIMATGEALADWQREISQLRAVWEIWSAVTCRAADRLGKSIRWEPLGLKFDHPTLGAWWIAGADEPERMALFVTGDLIAPGRAVVHRFINAKLRKLGVTALLVPKDQGFSKLEMRLVPQDLLGCIWLTFASAVDGGRQYNQCQDCRCWFEVTRHVARKDKAFCGGTCRASSHRKRVAEARRLFREGKSPRQIAGILGTSTQTVKGWVK